MEPTIGSNKLELQSYDLVLPAQHYIVCMKERKGKMSGTLFRNITLKSSAIEYAHLKKKVHRKKKVHSCRGEGNNQA